MKTKTMVRARWGVMLATGGWLAAAGAAEAPVLRDPFLPCDYVLAEVKNASAQEGAGNASNTASAAASKADWEGARRKVRIDGIMTRDNSNTVAMVNGGIVHIGDTLTVEHDGRTYLWKIKAITRNDVQLDRLDVR